MILFPSGIPLARALLLEHQTWVGCNRVSTQMPDGILSGTFIKLTRTGGGQIDMVRASPRVLVECYAPTDSEAEALARRAYAVLVTDSPEDVAGVWVYHRRETQGITEFYDTTRQFNRYHFEVAITLRGEEVHDG